MNRPNDPSLLNPLLIKLIALRADDDVLDLMSKTSLWQSLVPELSNQHFWYERTLTLVNFDIKYNPKENWHQVYNILSDKNPFSTGGALDLEVNGYNLFAVEMLIRLGYDPSIENSRALLNASKFGSPEVVKLLLRDKRVNPSKSRRESLKEAAKRDRLDVLLALLEDPRIEQSYNKEKSEGYILKTDPGIVNNALCIAAEVGSSIIVRELLQDPRVDPNVRDRYSLVTTIEKNRTEVVRALLQDKRLIIDTSSQGDLVHASRNHRTDIMRLLLEDPRTYDTLKLRIDLLKKAIDNSQDKIVSLLLEDSRVDPSGKRASDALASIGVDQSLDESKGVNKHDPQHVRWRKLDLEHNTEERRRVAEALIRSMNLDFRDERAYRMDRQMSTIISLIYENIRDSLEECVLLSRGEFAINSYSSTEDPISLTILLGDGERDLLYDNTHYSALLREIILKRLDLEYYLEWMLKQLRSRDTSAKTRRLFSSVAKSLLSGRSPVHTSEWFTAYRGFMLLTVSQDARVILNTLRQEERVTQEGINYAGALLGAFLGKKKVEG